MNPPFLDPDGIQRNCAEAALNAEATQAFLDFAARIRADATLLAHAIATHYCFYETRDNYTPTVTQAEATFGDNAPVLRALMVLDSIRLVREKQGMRGVPIDITRATLERHPCPTLREYFAQHGQIGADDWIWWWYRTVGSGDLYRLNRLEFIPEAWDYPWRVMVNDATGETVVLLNAGLGFTDEGYMPGPTTWTSSLQETEDAITGHVVSPHGVALRPPVRLSRTEWRQFPGPGDRILDMHIPGDTPLTLEAIRDALQQSVSFFDHFYPDKPFVAWVCDSWLFSTQIEGMLPPESNILRWQREGYLLPNDSAGDDFLAFVFGTSHIDPATAPRDTRLRRAVIAHLERGGQLRCGGYLLLRRDLPHFGMQPYRVASKQAIARLTVN